ncbi:hypothetical protein [Priestia megaterium]|nr:hypothetical protein [Priestia megaterium]MBT2259807.1 hypothetical protein [Priestia megaterium]
MSTSKVRILADISMETAKLEEVVVALKIIRKDFLIRLLKGSITSMFLT